MGISGTAVEQHAGLNEYDFQGLFAALGEDFPELTQLASGSMRDHYRALKQVLHLWSDDKIRGPLPETWAAFQQRVADARAAIQAGGGQRVLAISSGGPIAVVKNGDPITIDAISRKLTLDIPQEELDARLAKWRQPKPRYTRGVLAKFAKLATTASEGAVTDKDL